MGVAARDKPPLMRIRDIEIRNGLALAPMEGVTDLTFRRLIRRIGGCGLTCTEFIPARSLTEDVPQALKAAEVDPDEHPVTIQIYGRDPSLLADAARYVADLGADIVDLNMGCPSKKVCAHSGGSALMREPALAREIVAAMRAAVSIPFTVKMRSGWDPEHKNAPEMAWMCQEEGAEAVTVHWRTRTDKYGGVRELETLAEVKRRLSIPVFANGDIVDVPSALDTWAATGADGLMIGRGAVRDPWVFRRIERALHGMPELVVDAAEKERVLLGYYEAMRPLFRDDRGALGRMKKIARYFTEGLPHGAVLRRAIFHSRTVEEAYEGVASFFATLAAWERGAGPPPGGEAAPQGPVEPTVQRA